MNFNHNRKRLNDAFKKIREKDKQIAELKREIKCLKCTYYVQHEKRCTNPNGKEDCQL